MQINNINNFMQLINPDNTMSYNRLIAHAIGSNETLLYFSLVSKQLYYDSKDFLKDGYFYATAIDLQESTTLTQRQQAPIIRKLEQLGLIKTKIMGVPSKKYFQVIFDCEIILDLIEKGKEICENLRKTRENSTKKQAETEETSQVRQNVNPSIDKMSNLGLTKCQSLVQQNVNPRFDKMSNKTKYNKTKINKTKDNSLSSNSVDVNISINPSINQENDGQMDILDAIKQQLKDNVDFDRLCADYPIANHNYFAEIIDIAAEFIAYKRDDDAITIQGAAVPCKLVKDKLQQMTYESMVLVINAIGQYSRQHKIKNIKAFVISTAYNALLTANTAAETDENYDYGQMDIDDILAKFRKKEGLQNERNSV